MLITLSSYWWLFVFRGMLGVLFGIAALAYPDAALTMLLYFFAAFVLVEGSFITVASLDFRKENKRWWIYRSLGIAGVLAGALTLFNPDASTSWLLALAAGWSLILGGMGLVAAIKLRDELHNEWTLLTGSLLSVVFSAFLIIRPEGTAFGMERIIGLYALLFGVMLFTLGLRIKKEAMKKELAYELQD